MIWPLFIYIFSLSVFIIKVISWSQYGDSRSSDCDHILGWKKISWRSKSMSPGESLCRSFHCEVPPKYICLDFSSTPHHQGGREMGLFTGPKSAPPKWDLLLKEIKWRMDTGEAIGNLFYTFRLKKWKTKCIFKSVFTKNASLNRVLNIFFSINCFTTIMLIKSWLIITLPSQGHRL